MNIVRLLPLCFLFLTSLLLAADPLPRVLVLGDNIYNEPAKFAAGQLKGRVEIVWKQVADSSSALAQVEDLLGQGKWDLIHFNFGLTDLLYKDPATKSLRVMSKQAGGVRVTSPQQYEQNLRALLKRFQGTQAKLVWANTTPIGNSPTGIFDAGSEVEYNEIAAKVMREHRIPTTDLHALLTSQRDPKRPASGDPYNFDRSQLRVPLLDAIRRELGLLETE